MNFKTYCNIFESPDFTPYDKQRLNYHQTNVAQHRPKQVDFADPEIYDDKEGIKWLDIRKRDDRTLISAALDGYIDGAKASLKKYNDEKSKPVIADADTYLNTNDEESLKTLYKKYKNIVDMVLNFLKKYMHGTTTVYRGFNISEEDYIDLKRKHNIKIERDIVNVLDNRSKEFNSFSVSPFVAIEFANRTYEGKPIVISADVEPNDINFAFTAYLLGRHRGLGEFELNINNLKELKNVHLVHDYEAEGKRYLNKLEPESELQSRLDSGEAMESVFDSVKLLHEYDGDYYKCLKDCGTIIVKDRNIIVPRCRGVNYIGDGVFCITKLGVEGYMLYNSKTKRSSDIYSRIYSRAMNPDDKAVIARKDVNSCVLLSKVNCQPLIGIDLKAIERLPGATWYGTKSIWHSVEFYLVTLKNGKKTIVNGMGRAIIRYANIYFDNIKINSADKLTFIGKQGDKTINFVVKNGAAIQSL